MAPVRRAVAVVAPAGATSPDGGRWLRPSDDLTELPGGEQRQRVNKVLSVQEHLNAKHYSDRYGYTDLTTGVHLHACVRDCVPGGVRFAWVSFVYNLNITFCSLCARASRALARHISDSNFPRFFTIFSRFF